MSVESIRTYTKTLLEDSLGVSGFRYAKTTAETGVWKEMATTYAISYGIMEFINPTIMHLERQYGQLDKPIKYGVILRDVTSNLIPFATAFLLGKIIDNIAFGMSAVFFIKLASNAAIHHEIRKSFTFKR